MEPAVEFVLPLLGEVPGAYDEAALQVAASDQLLDEEAGHDRLAGAGVVGEKEPERLARQHRLVDRGDLVRQRVHHRGVHGENRVEQVRQPNPVGLGDEPEQRTVAVEAPGPALLDHLEARLIVPVQQLVGDTPAGVLVGELQRLRPVPLDAHHRGEGVRQDPTHARIRLELFELAHSLRPQVALRAISYSSQDGAGGCRMLAQSQDEGLTPATRRGMGAAERSRHSCRRAAVLSILLARSRGKRLDAGSFLP